MSSRLKESGINQALYAMDRRIGPTILPLGAIVAGVTMLENLVDQYEGDKIPEVDFTKGEIKGLCDFIDLTDTRVFRKLADMTVVHEQYLALEIANRIKRFERNSEKEGKLAAYRWALHRKGAGKLPIRLRDKSAVPL